MQIATYIMMFLTSSFFVGSAIKTRKDKTPATLLYIVLAILSALFLKEGLN